MRPQSFVYAKALRSPGDDSGGCESADAARTHYYPGGYLTGASTTADAAPVGSSPGPRSGSLPKLMFLPAAGAPAKSNSVKIQKAKTRWTRPGWDAASPEPPRGQGIENDEVLNEAAEASAAAVAPGTGDDMR